MKCCIMKDLLPNYIDSLNSEETSVEIRKHLEECADCRSFYEKVSAAIPYDMQSKDKNIDFLKKLKSKMLRRNIIIAVSTCIILLGSLVIFANAYQIPIPFDSNRMYVELIPEAVIYNEDGSITWVAMDSAPPQHYEYVRETLYIAWHGFSRIATSMTGRDIYRDGENVRVVFFRHTKTPWNSLFFDYDLVEWQSAGRTTGTQIYGDRFQNISHETQRIEIFYLPIRNWSRLHNLSDEDFDAERLNGWLVWGGVH